MWIWLMMLAFDMLVPLVMIIGGRIMMNNRRINCILGYRTERSMKNEDTWIFANGYCGKLWQKIGFIMIPVIIFAFVLLYFADPKLTAILGTVILFIECAAVLLSIYPVERALKKRFDDEGREY